MSHKTTLASVRLGRGEARMPLFVNWVGPATPQTPGRDEVLEGLRPRGFPNVFTRDPYHRPKTDDKRWRQILGFLGGFRVLAF